MLDNLMEMVDEDMAIDHKIRDLQHDRKMIQYKMVEECIKEKLFDLLKLDTTKLRRMQNLRRRHDI